MKPRFDIELYTDRGYAMICESEQDAIEFTEYLDSVGRRWRSGNSYLSKTCWNRFGDSCQAYFFNEGTHGSAHLVSDGHRLLYKDFSWNYYTQIETESWENFVSSFISA